ncbi:18S rRNA (guanine-N(7))-methyltransferase RID2-like isoform X2 [Lotus japonicus]|uniref:18S rRNA (guanine-N(7))-methyltransferase RID2-like isoform X2 n=1 Tax=Lotus japonicus TaxID=34305 RepID=UPI002583F163|nr:18S rRNA (guanine-N(7))-methyltransferase RID2-like isoform X2 [Lotus japonicus]
MVRGSLLAVKTCLRSHGIRSWLRIIVSSLKEEWIHITLGWECGKTAPQTLLWTMNLLQGLGQQRSLLWLCNADKSSHNPRLRLKAFFTSLYRCLTNGARAVFQVYPENLDQRELILNAAMHAGFAGGIVVDFPHSSKRRKEFLVLTCGQRSINASLSKPKDGNEESCSDDDNDEDEENQTVCISDRHRPQKKQKNNNKKGKGRDWILRKKEQMRRRGNAVPQDTKYTGRKRKDRF